MADLQAQFEIAAQAAQQLPARPDNATLLKLYALYKQATVGDISGSRPGATDFVGRAKYDSWSGLKGTSSEAAMQAYVDLVARLRLQGD
jgi:acyl-CoA-binding protein